VRTLLLFCALLLACEGETGDGFDRQPMLASLGETVILPTYEDFAERAAVLDEAVEAFCGAPGAETLSAAQAAFRATKTPLKQGEAFGLGPHVERPWRLMPLVDFWPPDVDDVQEMLASEDALDQDAIDLIGANRKGLPALDILLFGGDLDAPRDEAAILAAFETERRCAYAEALSENLAARAWDYVEAWSPSGDDYVGELAFAGEREVFSSEQAAASAVFDQLLFTIENARELKVGKPFGKRDGGTLQPRELEAPYSERSVQDTLDAIQGAENVYLGSYDGVQGIGIRDWLLARRPDLDAPLQQAFADAKDALAAIDGPLHEAIVSDAEGVEAAYQAIKSLQVLLATEVAGALGITVTFNPTDGD